MRFLIKLLEKLEKNIYNITEEEIEQQLNEYEKYLNENKENSIIKIKKSHQLEEIINQVLDQIYINNIEQDYEYNDYYNEEEVWTSIKAS